VITVCDVARERAPIFPFTPNLLHWSLEDPTVVKGSTEQKRTAFFRVRDAIRENVQEFLDELERKHPERAQAGTG